MSRFLFGMLELEGCLRTEHAVFAEQDVAIRENEKFRDELLLWDAEGPIGDFRRWAARFY